MNNSGRVNEEGGVSVIDNMDDCADVSVEFDEVTNDDDLM